MMTRFITILIALIIASPAGAAGLLTGQTPASYSLPTGWTLLRAQNFESGCNASYENCGKGQSYVGSGPGSGGASHSGTKALRGTYSQDGDYVGYVTYPGAYTEIYLSWYDYVDSTALFADEYYIAQFEKRTPSDTLDQEVIVDFLWSGTNYPRVSGDTHAMIQGMGRTWNTINEYGANYQNYPVGQWVQWEVHFKPNTSTGGVANEDGFLTVYKNGTTWVSFTNYNFNGTRSMNNLYAVIGGVYTQLVWSKTDPEVYGSGACNFPAECGSGSDGCRNYMGWTITFANPRCGPTHPSFNRYIDDVIVMTTGGATTDLSPPYVSTLSPSSGQSGVAITNRTISLHIKDGWYGVDMDSIKLTVEGVEYTCQSGLSCTGGMSDVTVTRTMTTDWSYYQTVNVSVDAKDIASPQNTMTTYSYSYTTQQEVIIPPSGDLDITTTELASGAVNVTYSDTLEVSGGESPVTWSISSGSLPPGLTLSESTGVISGLPTTAGVYAFTVKATDDAGASYSDDFNRTNETPITSPWSTPATREVNLTSNQIVAGGATYNRYAWRTEEYQNNHSSKFTYTGPAITNEIGGPCVRTSYDADGFHGYCVTILDDSTATFFVARGSLGNVDIEEIVGDYASGDTFELVVEGKLYETSFPATENPLSQDNNWTCGETTGIDFADVQTSSGWAYANFSTTHRDSVCHMTGEDWGPDQFVEATVYCDAGNISPPARPDPPATPAYGNPEVELWLRGNISANSLKGHECWWSCGRDDDNSYFGLAKWSGPFESWEDYPGTIINNEPGAGVENGDVIRCQVTGKNFRVYKNGILSDQAYMDNAYTTGAPGIGFNGSNYPVDWSKLTNVKIGSTGVFKVYQNDELISTIVDVEGYIPYGGAPGIILHGTGNTWDNWTSSTTASFDTQALSITIGSAATPSPAKIRAITFRGTLQ